MQLPSMHTTDNGFQRDQAYTGMRRLLILQQVSEGERLRESEWAARLGVNRTALREAFARLAAEGVLELRPKRGGYFVPRLAPDDIFEIMEVRIMLEGGAILRICQMGLNTPEHLAGMQKACDDFEHLLREGYLLGVAEADRRFHEALIEAAANRRLTMLYLRAPLPIVYPRMFSHEQWLARAARDTLHEHQAILSAVLASDVAEAQRLLRTHLLERFTLTLRSEQEARNGLSPVRNTADK